MEGHFEAEPGMPDPPTRRVCVPPEVDLNDRIKRIAGTPRLAPVCTDIELPTNLHDRVERRGELVASAHDGRPPDMTDPLPDSPPSPEPPDVAPEPTD